MQINTKKTNIMLFSRSRSRDFQPELFINNELLDVVDTTKLLGVMISSNLKWDAHIEYIRSKAMKRMWMLRRIKEVGGTPDDQVLVYILQIRSLTEKECQLWNGGLTKKCSDILERIQKAAFKIILGQNYNSYSKALQSLNLKTLKDRRHQLCQSFGRKQTRSSKFKVWFKKSARPARGNSKINLPQTRTTIYKKSPLVYLTNLINAH